MLGHRDRSQGTLFIPGSLEQLVPEDHILKRVDKVLDLTWLREEVRDCYDEANGRPSIDPESAVRLMLAGFFHGFVHDRKLMREAEVNLAIRWFAGYQLLDRLPDHSTLTRIRQRWGEELFRRIFEKTVESCVKAGLVAGETIHADATLIRADVSWKSLTTKHMDDVLEAHRPEEDPPPSGKKRGRPRNHPKVPKKRSTTDPDATMTTSNRRERLQPSYKQHTTVDDMAGVVLDVELTTGEVSEGRRLPEVLERAESITGKRVKCVTADGGYAQPANYRTCEDRGTVAVIPPQLVMGRRKRVPARRFRYDAKHDIVRCPMRRVLKRSYRAPNGWIYKARSRDCTKCVHRAGCVTRGNRARTVLIINDYGALLRARRQWVRRDEQAHRVYRRHRWQIEGKHGEGKTQHGLRRAVRRGRWNVAIQVYLTAAVMNLKVLAGLLLWLLVRRWRSQGAVVALSASAGRDSGRHRGINEQLDLAA
jgi:transposase